MQATRILFGLLVLAVGFIFLGNNFGWWPSFNWSSLWQLWPILLIIVGLRQLIRNDGLFALLAFAFVIAGLALTIFQPALFSQGFDKRPMPAQPSENIRDRDLFRPFRQSGEQGTFQSELSTTDSSGLTLDLGGYYKVNLEGRDETKVTVNLSGPKEAIDNLIFAPEDNRLVLKQKESLEGWRFLNWRDQAVTGTITLPKSLGLTGQFSGLVEATAKDLNSALALDASGASKIEFSNSTVTDPTIKLSGATQVVLDRCSGKADIELSGASKFRANDCQLAQLVADVSGASNLELNGSIVDANLDASGASKISLPKPSGQLQQDKSGTADITIR